jgi:hypothetical protein
VDTREISTSARFEAFAGFAAFAVGGFLFWGGPSLLDTRTADLKSLIVC